MAHSDTGLTVALTVNGAEKQIEVTPWTLLVHVLRDQLGLTGTHVGCVVSRCGACTVLLDGRPVKSCTLLAVQVDGRSIDTIEGLSSPEDLHPLQYAFWEHDAAECGYCTPGMIMACVPLMDTHEVADADISKAISGNLCRCTGYQNIVEAIRTAVDRGYERPLDGHEPEV